jgi:hypothetical protein
MFPWHMTKLKPESPRSILLHLGVLFIVLDSSDVEDVIASVVNEGSGMIEGERKDIVGMRKNVEVRENSNIEGFRIVKKRKQHMISLCAGDIDEKQHPFREPQQSRADSVLSFLSFRQSIRKTDTYRMKTSPKAPLFLPSCHSSVFASYIIEEAVRWSEGKC